MNLPMDVKTVLGHSTGLCSSAGPLQYESASSCHLTRGMWCSHQPESNLIATSLPSLQAFMDALLRQEVALTLLKFLGSSSWQPVNIFRWATNLHPPTATNLCECYFTKVVAKEVVCTNIDNNLLLGSGLGTPTYRPAAELSGTHFEIGPNRI
ncbi:hypothetical protein E2C01_007339 [Portunus trituberculatus]|uniref:Uncharacterized protein n=1 Tax=Portunus trituberculatus TaxID=210409 RepID=A0A5B7CYQ9_PORTR|nr:hypothetical protein [Portunus trituberculatus]